MMLLVTVLPMDSTYGPKCSQPFRSLDFSKINLQSGLTVSNNFLYGDVIPWKEWSDDVTGDWFVHGLDLWPEMLSTYQITRFFKN